MRAGRGMAVVAFLSVAAVSGCTLTDAASPALTETPPASPADSAAAGICGAGRVALDGGPPGAPAPDPSPAVSPAGTWIITDNSAECGCRLTLTEGAFGRHDVEPAGCRHPGIAGVRRFGLGATPAGTELALLAENGEQVVLRLTRATDSYYAGVLNGRPVVMWRPAADDQQR